MNVVYIVHVCKDCKRMHAGFVDVAKAIEFRGSAGFDRVQICDVDPSIKIEYSKFLRLICE